MLTKPFLVDAHRDGGAHGLVLHDVRCVVGLAEEHAAREAVGNVVVVVVEQLVARVRQAIGGIHFAGLQGALKRIGVGELTHDDGVDLRGAAPVVLVLVQGNLGIGHGLGNVGAGAGHVAVLGHARLHVDDAAVRVAQVVDERRARLARLDGDGVALGGDVGDLHVAGRTVVLGDQVVEAFLHGLAVHGAAVRELHVVAQRDLHMRVIDELVRRWPARARPPWRR